MRWSWLLPVVAITAACSDSASTVDSTAADSSTDTTLERRVTARDTVAPTAEATFSDGHWQGAMTTSVLTLAADGITAVRHEETAPIEFTIIDGEVTDGSFELSFLVQVTTPAGSGEATGTIVGGFSGSGDSPQMLGETLSIEGTMTSADGVKLPLSFSQPITASTTDFGTTWVIDPITDPDIRSGQIDISAYTAYMQTTGFSVNDAIVTFQMTRT